MVKIENPINNKDIAIHKFFLSFVLFSLILLLLIAPVLHFDLSDLVLLIMSTGCLFMLLRAASMLRLAYQIPMTIKRYFCPGADSGLSGLKWRHVIVVPIYKETVETIESTVRSLSLHRSSASNYVILCAHEKADVNHEEKFRHIHETLADRFLGLIKSAHVVAPQECPGKAANINHAVRSYAASQDERYFSGTMVTVIDCDTLINEYYFYELERKATAVANPHSVIFAAPAFFEINRGKVPCFVRAVDDLWSLAGAANIFSNSKLGFPISNYSLSLKMLDEMGYWDVDYDSVGEDFHTFIKATVKLDEDVWLIPIGIPMNNENVIGHTYTDSLFARYSQAMRHALGIASTAYLFKHILSSTFSMRKCVVFLLCLESHCFPMLYFAVGIHVYECVLANNFHTYFHDEKLLLFYILSGSTFVLANVIFASYKTIQFFLRHRVFNKPCDIAAEGFSDLCDLCVQGLSALAYFMVPFGFRAYQNLVFKTNKVYYSKVEERTRRY